MHNLLILTGRAEDLDAARAGFPALEGDPALAGYALTVVRDRENQLAAVFETDDPDAALDLVLRAPLPADLKVDLVGRDGASFHSMVSAAGREDFREEPATRQEVDRLIEQFQADPSPPDEPSM